VTKAGMIDRTVADAAFALKEGEVSAPVQGRFGTVLVQALKIEPEQVRSFGEVAGELKQELAAARAKSDMLGVYDKIEDARAEGKPLAEAAALLKLEARTIEATDRSGRDPAGQPINLPDAQRLLAAAFTTDVGVERDPLQFQDGYIWFDVAGITPARERPLDEVKEQAEQRWREQEIATRLNTKATEILDKLKGGAALADVAAADHLTVQTLTGLKRGEGSGALSAGAIDAVFRTAKDAVGKADAAQPTEQVVFRVTDIVVPAIDAASEEAKRTVETLNRGLSEDIFGEYVAKLESDIGVTINQGALNQVVTGGATNTGDDAN
jgi:peptidyl-prolyl cis-trans isomerase D